MLTCGHEVGMILLGPARGHLLGHADSPARQPTQLGHGRSHESGSRLPPAQALPAPSETGGKGANEH